MWNFQISDNFAFQLAGLVVLMAMVAVMGWRQSRRVRLLHEEEIRQLRDNARRYVMPDPPVVRLPVVQEPACQNCAHWDLEEGQAQMAEHPAFQQVTHLVSPAKMSQRAEVDGHGNLLMNGEGDIVKSELGIPYKAKWSEFGACSKHSEARWKDDKCEHHKPRALAEAVPATEAATA